mgnify:CR=1 FL=1
MQDNGIERISPPVSPLAFSDVWTDGFEGDPWSRGWNTADYSITASTDYWHIDTYNAFAGNSWWCGTLTEYPTPGYGNLWNQFMSIDVDLTTATAPCTMTFWHRYDVENGWDFCAIDIFHDGQWELNWQQWTGDSGGWVNVNLDLSPFVGQQIKVRFRFNSDPLFSDEDNNYDSSGAWYWDEFKIYDSTNIYIYDDVESGNIGWTINGQVGNYWFCLLYTSPSPRDQA